MRAPKEAHRGNRQGPQMARRMLFWDQGIDIPCAN